LNLSVPTRRADWNIPSSLFTRVRKGRNTLVSRLHSVCPRRFVLRRTATGARSMGVHILRTTHENVVGLRKLEKEKADFCTAKKCGKKGNPINHSFVQLIEKIEKLKEALKKSGKKGKKCR
jgi:hypothetical protein